MHVIGGVTNHVRTRWPEWALALQLLVQSILIANGPNPGANQLYIVMRSMLSLHNAASGAGVVAVAWLLALFLNGTFIEFRRVSPWLRVVTATAAAVYWTFWSYGIWKATGNITSVAWFNYAAYAGMAAMCVFMAASEVAHADSKARQWHQIRRRIGSQ